MRAAFVLACALLLAVPPQRTLVAQIGRTLPPARPSVQEVDDARLDRLTRWLEAIDRHAPGARDEAAIEVSAWSAQDLRLLLVDVRSLLTLVADPRTNHFYLHTEDGRSVEINYPRALRVRLGVLACAAAGDLRTERCQGLEADRVAEPLRRLASDAAAAVAAGDVNYVVRRGVLLHTDIVTLGGAGFGLGEMLELDDGRLIGSNARSGHSLIAARLVERVVPAGASKPAPARDPMVRDWFISAAEWMEGQEKHWEYLDRARELFPNDPQILFLSGCQHEDLATPSIQEPLRGLNRAALRLPVDTPAHELRQAETFFRRALAASPGMAAARLRLAHVLLQQGRYGEAAHELEQARLALTDTTHQYYAELFAGSAAESLGRYDEAGEAYTRAAALYPSAQAPYLAMSELESRRGRTEAAQHALDRIFATAGRTDRDPWWTYHNADVDDPDAALELFRRHFTRPASR